MNKIKIELTEDQAYMMLGLCAAKNYEDSEMQNMISSIFRQTKDQLNCKVCGSIVCNYPCNCEKCIKRNQEVNEWLLN